MFNHVRRVVRFEIATGGTLFLDEIANLTLPMQAKLLTAIEKQEITRLGATASLSIDVRLICATNGDIHEMVEEAEVKAWQKLISVLTHEIMNSIAPIISLSETLSEPEGSTLPSSS